MRGRRVNGRREGERRMMEGRGRGRRDEGERRMMEGRRGEKERKKEEEKR